MFLWLPPEAPSPGRDRRDPLPRLTHSELRVGVRGGHHGVLRRDRPHRPDGPGATSDRRQARPGLGEGVPAGRDPHRGGPQPRDDHRHPPRRDPLTAAGQHRPVRAGRALRRQVGSARPGMDTRQAPPRRRPGHEARPLRGRLRGHGRTAPATTPKRCGTRSAAVLAPMGLRLSEEKTRVCHIDEGFDFLGWRIQRRRLARPNRQAGGLHLPVEEGARLDHRTRCGSLTRRATTSNARRPAAPAQPGAAGLVQLLPSRRVLADLQLRRPLRLLADRRLAPQTTRRAEHAHPGPPLPPRLEDPRRTGSRCSGPTAVAIERYRYRGTKIPTPWSSATTGSPAPAA